MLTFLNSFLAWSLLAAAIPILIHLFTRKKLKRIPFSTLQFLRSMQKEKIRQVRLKQWLLLALRTLIIILLVLAFMQPTLRQNTPLSGQSLQAAVVFIVDNSLSMQTGSRGATRLAMVRQALGRIEASLTPGDRITLITAAAPARVISQFTLQQPGNIAEQLGEVKLSHSEADFDAAFRLAVKTLTASALPNREIFWLSDQKIKAPRVRREFPGEENILVYSIATPPEKVRNLTVTDLRADAAIIEPGKAIRVKVSVQNTGDFDESDRLLSLFLNEQRVAQTQVSVPAGEERTLTLRIVPRQAGFQFMRAVVENDQNNADNERFSLFYIAPESRILIVAPERENRRFIRLALQAAHSGASRQVVEMTPEHMPTTALNEFDVVILSNVARFSPSVAAKIDRYVRDGGGLILFLGERVDVRNYNSTLFKSLAIGELLEGIGDISAAVPVLRLGKINREHPVFAPIFAEGGKARVETPFFRFALQARLSDAAIKIMEYSNGLPLLAEVTPEQGRALIFFTSADDRWSDIVYKGVFAPLVDRSVRYAAGRGRLPVAELSAGEPLQHRVVSDGEAGFTLVLPDQRRVKLRPELDRNAFLLRYDGLQQAGFYHLLTGEEQRYALAVNFDPEEMTTAALPADSLQAGLRPLQVVSLSMAGDLPEKIREHRRGQPLWRIFLVLAFLALIAEMLIFRDSEEKAPAVSARQVA